MGSEARARLGLAGLLAITLFSFNQVFATGDYPGPALLGILIAVAVAMVGRRLGAGSVLTIVGSLVVMVAYLCLVFQADKTFRGLPSPRALEGLWRSLQHAYSQSQVDFSPVPPRPGYVVMVVAGLWLAALMGEIAAFRWRRPLLASLPCIGLFALIMVVGTGEAAPLLVALFLIALFAFWGLESSHRLRAWGRWVPTWKEHESEPEPTEVTGSLARRMGAACVLMGLVVPLFLPALGDGLLVWRNPTGEGLPGGGGGGEGGALDPLVSVRPQLINQPETVLFEVTSLRPSYWRLLTYTQFNGVSWHGSSQADRTSQFGAISTDVDPGTVTRTVKASFVMRALDGERLPTTGLPRELEFTGSNAEEYESGLSYDAESGDVEMDQRIIDGLRYEVSAVLPEASFRNLSRAVPGEIENPTYRQIPNNLSDVVFETANEWTEGIDNPFRQLVAIQNRLRSFDYSLDVEDTGSDDYLGDFLTVTRRGFCQQFASAFAILARLKGISTRVVVGFLPGTTDLSAPTNYSVRGTHAHVWPEAYFQGYGWVPFEPTPRGPAPPPAYTVPGLAAGPRPDFQIVGGNQARGNRGPAARLANEPINPGGIEQAPPSTNPVNLEWKKTFTRVALFLTILALAYLVVTPAWKLRRISARYRRARDSRARAAAAFAHFQEEAGDLVSRKAPAESATAYATRLATLRKVPERPALRLASIYEASEYAPTETLDTEASEARDLARQLRSTIWGGASWWDRGQRLFSPAWNGRKVA